MAHNRTDRRGFSPVSRVSGPRAARVRTGWVFGARGLHRRRTPSAAAAAAAARDSPVVVLNCIDPRSRSAGRREPTAILREVVERRLWCSRRRNARTIKVPHPPSITRRCVRTPTLTYGSTTSHHAPMRVHDACTYRPAVSILEAFAPVRQPIPLPTDPLTRAPSHPPNYPHIHQLDRQPTSPRPRSATRIQYARDQR